MKIADTRKPFSVDFTKNGSRMNHSITTTCKNAAQSRIFSAYPKAEIKIIRVREMDQ